MKIDYLCNLDKKDIKENIGDIIKVVSKPKFICEKCARVSSEKKYLCNPVKISKKENK
jgi:hypothetical protein